MSYLTLYPPQVIDQQQKASVAESTQGMHRRRLLWVLQANFQRLWWAFRPCSLFSRRKCGFQGYPIAFIWFLCLHFFSILCHFTIDLNLTMVSYYSLTYIVKCAPYSFLHPHLGYDFPPNRGAVRALQRYVRILCTLHETVREESLYQRQVRRLGESLNCILLTVGNFITDDITDCYRYCIKNRVIVA